MAVIVQRPPLSHTPFSSVIILLPNGWGVGGFSDIPFRWSLPEPVPTAKNRWSLWGYPSQTGPSLPALTFQHHP